MYSFIFCAQNLLTQTQGVPWHLAPKALAKAAKDVETAQTKLVDAVDARSDAEVGLPAAQAAWDAAGKVALRASKRLPSRVPLDTAKFALQVAQEDEAAARQGLNTAIGNVGSMLEVAAVRDEWRAAINAHLAELQSGLTALAGTVSAIVAEVTVDVGVTHFLGQWLTQANVPDTLAPTDPAGAVMAAANLKAYQDPTPAPVARFAKVA